MINYAQIVANVFFTIICLFIIFFLIMWAISVYKETMRND